MLLFHINSCSQCFQKCIPKITFILMATTSRVEERESFPSREWPYTYSIKRNTLSLFHIRVRPSRVEELESFPSRVWSYTFCIKRNHCTVSLFHIRVRPHHELKNWKVFLLEYGLTRIVLKEIQSHFLIYD